MISRISLFLSIGIALIVGITLLFFLPTSHPQSVTFFVSYNGTSTTVHTGEENSSIAEALQAAGYTLTDKTRVFPERDQLLSAGSIITIDSAKEITVEDNNEIHIHHVAALTVAEALEKVGVTLVGADFVEPSAETALSPGMNITVTRVTVSEETEDTSIPFSKKEEEDESVSFLVKKIVQKGESGTLTTRYRVSRHNGKIVAKEKIEAVVTKEPKEEKTLIGTKVTVLKKHTGGASWYAHTGTLSAANPWLPFGSYVRVTNTANGKSVIVKINDRGPFGGGRIIDLDKVAFAKIADLGTGVVNVVMEEIK